MSALVGFCGSRSLPSAFSPLVSSCVWRFSVLVAVLLSAALPVLTASRSGRRVGFFVFGFVVWRWSLCFCASFGGFGFRVWRWLRFGRFCFFCLSGWVASFALGFALFCRFRFGFLELRSISPSGAAFRLWFFGVSVPEKQLKNGFEKCREMHPKVSLNGGIGRYLVKGNENIYNVKLFRDERGQKLAECCCKDNENGMFCYHIAAAFLAHTGIMRQR